ncbi:hypothetical protein COL95_29535 [Bacillus anthracis]|nr:hypothetical protein COL95_29535 [Bacillus anthracis]
MYSKDVVRQNDAIEGMGCWKKRMSQVERQQELITVRIASREGPNDVIRKDADFQQVFNTKESGK